jgi:hypothetical protein
VTLATVAQAAVPAVGTVAKGGWTLTGLITSIAASGTFGVVLLAFVKILPTWREQGIGARKDELTRINARLDKVEQENTRLRTSLASSDREINETKIKMISMRMAFQLVAGEIARADPDNPVLRQARDLIAQAAIDDLGMGDLGKQLAMLPSLHRDKAKEADKDKS